MDSMYGCASSGRAPEPVNRTGVFHAAYPAFGGMIPQQPWHESTQHKQHKQAHLALQQPSTPCKYTLPPQKVSYRAYQGPLNCCCEIMSNPLNKTQLKNQARSELVTTNSTKKKDDWNPTNCLKHVIRPVPKESQPSWIFLRPNKGARGRGSGPKDSSTWHHLRTQVLGQTSGRRRGVERASGMTSRVNTGVGDLGRIVEIEWFI